MMFGLSCSVSGREKHTVIKGTTDIKGINEITISGFEENPIWDFGKEYTIQPDSNNCFHLDLDIKQFSEMWI